MDALTGTLISMLIFIAICVACMFITFYMQKRKLKKQFDDVKIGSVWTFYQDVGNPFDDDKRVVVVLEKKVNENGDGYIKYKEGIGLETITFTESAKDFFHLYRHTAEV